MADMRYASSNSATTSIPESSYKVLRQTYMLLSMTLLWSAVCAGLSFALQPPYFFTWVCFIPAIIMMFTMRRWANSPSAIIWVFVFTGLMGASWLVMQSLAMTAGIFFFASGYVLTTKKDLSFMGGFLMTGLWVLIGSIVAMWIAGFFGVEITGFSLAISAAAVLLFSMFILYDTSSIVQGHQTNYVYATVGLYLNLFNLFVHLLSLFGFANDD
jgi:modulator of FtsH protease